MMRFVRSRDAGCDWRGDPRGGGGERRETLARFPVELAVAYGAAARSTHESEKRRRYS